MVFVLDCKQGATGGVAAGGLRIAIGHDFSIDERSKRENERLVADFHRAVIDAGVLLMHNIGGLQFGLSDHAHYDSGVGIDEELAVIGQAIGLEVVPVGGGLEVTGSAAAGGG